MKLGIIGLPQTGKTTLFNALTGHDQPTTASAGRIEVHTAVVDVPDPRVDTLSAMYNPKKTAYAKVTYADIAGLEGSGQGSISGQLLNQIAQMDGLIHVVRCFEDDSVPHAAGSVNPLRDIDSMNSELLLNDLIVVERKLEKLTEERKRGGTDKVINARQTELFERILAILSEDKPLRGVEFSDQELNDIFLPLQAELAVIACFAHAAKRGQIFVSDYLRTNKSFFKIGVNCARCLLRVCATFYCPRADLVFANSEERLQGEQVIRKADHLIKPRLFDLIFCHKHFGIVFWELGNFHL